MGHIVICQQVGVSVRPVVVAVGSSARVLGHLGHIVVTIQSIPRWERERTI